MEELPQPLDTLASSAGITHVGARLWFRVPEERQFEVRILGPSGDTFALFPLSAGTRFGDGVHVVAYPDDVPGARPLSPETAYRYALARTPGAAAIVEGRFETAPPPDRQPAEPFGIALMSCHQPFDDRGRPDARSLRMLEALPKVLARERVKRVLMVGDQMYTDFPPKYSLFERSYFRKVAPPGRRNILECTAHEVRSLLHERYRHAWALRAFDRLQRDWPCYMIPDDHEFIDNWGSDPEHAKPKWEAFSQGAVSACHDYEMARHGSSAEPPFHHSFEYGNVATFIMDLRTQKYTRGDEMHMFGAEQLAALERFLSEHRHAAFVMLGLSLPLFYLPDGLGWLGARLFPEGSDVHDRWSAPRARGARDQLVSVLKSHRRRCPRQQMILLGGDVHVSLAARLKWHDTPGHAYQFTASPLSNNAGRAKLWCAGALASLSSALDSEDGGGLADTELVPGKPGFDRNPLPKLNVGILAFRPRGGTLDLSLKLYTYDRRSPGSAKLVYRSPAISAECALPEARLDPTPAAAQ